VVTPAAHARSDETEAQERLRSVRHIVVLMMENRSFDQMLGFLEGEGAGHDLELHEFQDEFVRFVLAMREHGLPPNQP
jgi:phospholipase C